MTEAEWLACDEPQNLARFARGRINPQRFRWLAADWGGRIRHVFEADDLLWFDAFAAWTVGAGPHPAEVCQPREWYPLDYPLPVVRGARHCAEFIRRDDPMMAAAYAAISASEDYPWVPPDPPDRAHTHRGRSAAKRAAVKAQTDAHRKAWEAARSAHADRTCREFCDQFRDVAGNLFRTVTLKPGWKSEPVVGLAEAIDADRAFDRLPILADALEEAGCDDADVLAHCRGPGPHVRGCWVVDLVLGKS